MSDIMIRYILTFDDNEFSYILYNKKQHNVIVDEYSVTDLETCVNQVLLNRDVECRACYVGDSGHSEIPSNLSKLVATIPDYVGDDYIKPYIDTFFSHKFNEREVIFIDSVEFQDSELNELFKIESRNGVALNVSEISFPALSEILANPDNFIFVSYVDNQLDFSSTYDIIVEYNNLLIR